MNTQQTELSKKLTTFPQYHWVSGMKDAAPDDDVDNSYPDLTDPATTGILLNMMWNDASPYIHFSGSCMSGYSIELPDFMFRDSSRYLYSRWLGEVVAMACIRVWESQK